MIFVRMIAPDWLIKKGATKVVEGAFSDDEITDFNSKGYNIYYLPNYPSQYPENATVNGSHVDTFEYVFIDFDLKSNTYPSKDAFLEKVISSNFPPTSVVDSGNGIHIYWRVTDLTAQSYLRLSRRLMRYFNTDEAVGKIFQLMRLPNTYNTKKEAEHILCEVIGSSDVEWTCEELDKLLPPIQPGDEAYCEQHYNKTNNINVVTDVKDDSIPDKFGKLLRSKKEVQNIFTGQTSDRSKNDYRLCHLLKSNDFTKEEAFRVMLNSPKAQERAPIHRISYAQNIVDSVWNYEDSPDDKKPILSSSVEDVLKRTVNHAKNQVFQCHKRVDNTVRGFRIGDVMGLVGGSGVGKTAFGLNLFKWCAEFNPDYHHFVVPLEQPDNEIAERWAKICNGNTDLNKKVHVMSNYDSDGNFRHLSFSEIKEYIQQWERGTGNKVGCVMVDHIGALKKKDSDNENQGLMDICHEMKAFAVQTKTFLIMQSQTSREKAGWGDLELDKDAAYGTTTFEWYCDYLVTIWQPLKRCHSEESCPTVTAFKYCKIRHKHKNDVIKEDVRYHLSFEPDTETFDDLTEDKREAFKFFLAKSTNKRKQDRKTDVLDYHSVKWNETKTDNN